MADLGWNDALRFGLELTALGTFASWGWTATGGPLRYGLAMGLPVLEAALWGTFRVPGDPGDAPVAVPGPVRLLFEVVLFVAAGLALGDAVVPAVAAGFRAVVLGPYVVARDRVRWLVGKGDRD